MASKKLVFVVNVDWFFVSHRLPIALEAISNGYEVHLICKDTGLKPQLSKHGIICHDISFSRSGSKVSHELITLLNLRRVIKEIAPDLIHAVTIKPVIYSGLILHSLKHKPCFVAAISGLGYVFSATSIRARLTRLLVSLLYKTAFIHKNKMIIFQNSTDDEILSRVVGLNEKDKFLIKGSGADLGVYNVCPEPDDKIIKVIMACRLLKEKGIYEYVEAAKIIHSQFDNVQFLLAGTPDKDNPNSISQAELDEWDNKGIVKALGHRDDIPQLFAESHIVTMPSYYGEGVPKVLIEAAACGRPIVTTNNPGCRDSIIPEVSGKLIPIKDHKALAKALIEFIENKRMRKSMGLKGREYAVKEFDVTCVVKKHMEIYSSLLSKV
jgi:glycosyltransferase involved in cell wall biosynthesis